MLSITIVNFEQVVTREVWFHTLVVGEGHKPVVQFYKYLKKQSWGRSTCIIYVVTKTLFHVIW